MPHDRSPLTRREAAAIGEVGRIVGPVSAQLMAAEAIEAVAAERRARQVRAHGNSQVAPLIHDAIDQALGLAPSPASSEDEDSFGGLFPSHPLGHAIEDRPPAVYTNASADLFRHRQGRPVSDAELHASLFGDSYYDEAPPLGPLSEDD